MYRDTTPTIKLRSWPVNAALFDGEVAAGLVPTLFAPDPEAASAAISANRLKAHYDVNKLNKVLFMPEHLQLKEALHLLKKHRYSPFKISHPFNLK